MGELNMLIGTVPYLNALPLIRGLDYNIRKAPPAVLERLLRLGEVDIATAPVTTLFEHTEWRAIPGIAIGTKKAAQSVLLCTRSPDITLKNVTSIYLDMESRTSAQLLKVLLALKYGRPLKQIKFVSPIPVPEVEAKLLIGDKALHERFQPSWSGPIFDLGREWTEWTELPFVFACWISRKQHVDPEVAAALQRAVRRNLSELEGWISSIKGFDPAFLKTYFLEAMNYGFGREEQQGLMTFHQYLREIDLAQKPFDLRFVSP